MTCLFVRRRIGAYLDGALDESAAGSTARSLASVVIEAGRDQSLAHAPLLIFAMAAAMLTLFMVRT